MTGARGGLSAGAGPAGGAPVAPRVDVRPVRTRRELRAFVRLPWGLYRGDPNWVPPLRRDVRKAFDPEHHPFHSHSDVQPFLALRDRRPVGRICAIHNTRHVEFHGEPVGFFGWFECEEDPGTARALFDAAADWLRERGLETMRGPTSFSTNEETGLLVEGFDRPPVVMMPYNPPYYAELLRSAGFREAKTLVAYLREGNDPPDYLTRAERIVKARYDLKVRPIRMEAFEEELATARELYNEAWEENWGFVPMTDEEFAFLARELKPVVEPSLVLFAETPDGDPVGFAVALRDYNQALKHADGRLFPFGLLKILWHARSIELLRVLTLGIVPEWRGKGVDALLYREIYRAGRELGIRDGEFSWMLEDNEAIRRPMERMDARVYKRYRLYDREL